MVAKAAQEEAGKHVYATNVHSYRSGCQALLNTEICNFNNLSNCYVHTLPCRRSRARALARRRQRECDPSLKHCRSSCCCWPRPRLVCVRCCYFYFYSTPPTTTIATTFNTPPTTTLTMITLPLSPIDHYCYILSLLLPLLPPLLLLLLLLLLPRPLCLFLLLLPLLLRTTTNTTPTPTTYHEHSASSSYYYHYCYVLPLLLLLLLLLTTTTLPLPPITTTTSTYYHYYYHYYYILPLLLPLLLLLLSGPQKVMKSLEDNFIKGYLDIPEVDNCSPAAQPSTQKTSKKRVALADVDTNVPETGAEAEPKQKTKRRTKKSKDSCLPVTPEATGVILDIAEFDLETQATTVQDEMCKDVKLLV